MWTPPTWACIPPTQAQNEKTANKKGVSFARTILKIKIINNKKFNQGFDQFYYFISFLVNILFLNLFIIFICWIYEEQLGASKIQLYPRVLAQSPLQDVVVA